MDPEDEADEQLSPQGVKQQIIWLKDKGKNTITREDIIPELLHIVGGGDPTEQKKVLEEKPFESVKQTVGEKLACLTPPLHRVDCPLAARIGIPLAVYAYPEAKPGEPPSKGDPNMLAMLLTRRLDGSQRKIIGKALVCFDNTLLPGWPHKDLGVMFLAKILFFSCDLYKDTIGFVKGA